MLVSIIVVTYNSADFLIECLDSIKIQNYQEIELIVTDDCSTDETILVAKKWFEKNKNRFVSAQIIETTENTGVAGNCNRGLAKAKGEWAKFIAGDDMLADESVIKTYIDNTPQDPYAGAIFSDVYGLRGTNRNLMRCRNVDIMFGNNSSSKIQNSILIKENFLPATSAFVHLSALKDVGGYDESIPMCEDAVLWIKLTMNGYKLFYINSPLVVYRIHENSLVGQFHGKISTRLLHDQIEILNRYKIPGHKGLLKIHFKWLKQLLVWVSNASKKSERIAQLLMFFYRFSHHSINRLYFHTLRIK